MTINIHCLFCDQHDKSYVWITLIYSSQQALIIPILQMRKLRLIELNNLFKMKIKKTRQNLPQLVEPQGLNT